MASDPIVRRHHEVTLSDYPLQVTSPGISQAPRCVDQDPLRVLVDREPSFVQALQIVSNRQSRRDSNHRVFAVRRHIQAPMPQRLAASAFCFRRLLSTEEEHAAPAHESIRVSSLHLVHDAVNGLLGQHFVAVWIECQFI